MRRVRLAAAATALALSQPTPSPQPDTNEFPMVWLAIGGGVAVAALIFYFLRSWRP